MNERESGGYQQAGRFEAMSRTRDAFTGNVREKTNIRSQQLAVERNDSHQVQTFTREQFKTKSEVIGTQDKISSQKVQSAWDTYGQMEQGLLKSEQAFQLDMQLPLAIEQKLGEAGKEQVLSAIKARKAQAEKAANTEAVAQEQALTQQEIQAEADKLLAMAPDVLLAGSLATLAVWAINRLPNKIYRRAPIALVLGLLLPMISACSTINSTPTAEVPNFTSPTSAETGNIDATLEPAAQATATAAKEQLDSASTAIVETKQASRAAAFLESYIAGQSVDVSQLSPSEFKEFSTKLAEKKNTERGINPILYNNEAYIHPDNLMMFDYDGHPDQQETIEMYLAIAGKDSEGNLQIIDEEGKTITIANSAGIDWNMRVTDMNDPRIDIANTGEPLEINNGMTFIQKRLSLGTGENSLCPIILLDKTSGLIYFDGDGSNSKQMPTLQFLKIETDQNGQPLVARKFLLFPNGGISLYKESLDKSYASTKYKESMSNSSLYKNLNTNSVYYLLVGVHQENIYKNNLFVTHDNYTGLIAGDEAAATFYDSGKNDTDMLILASPALIEPAN